MTVPDKPQDFGIGPMNASRIVNGAAALIAVALLAPSSAAAQVPPVSPPVSAPAAPQASTPAATGENAEYVIGPEDTIEVGIVGQADKIRAKVYTDGTFQMNLIGSVNAAGLTPRQLAADIAKALKAGGYYANPVVDVQVVGYASRYVTVLGAVAQPGLVPMNRSYHLSEILARVGGVQEDRKSTRLNSSH